MERRIVVYCFNLYDKSVFVAFIITNQHQYTVILCGVLCDCVVVSNPLKTHIKAMPILWYSVVFPASLAVAYLYLPAVYAVQAYSLQLHWLLLADSTGIPYSPPPEALQHCLC